MEQAKRCAGLSLGIGLSVWLACAPSLDAREAVTGEGDSGEGAAVAVSPDDADEHPYRPEPVEDEHRTGEDGAGPRVSFGSAAIEGLEPALYARVETEYFVQEARGDRRRLGPLSGVLVGVDGWGSDEGGGVGLPTTLYLGLRYPLLGRQAPVDLFTTVGVGWHWVIWDAADSDSGLGIMAPLGIGNFGFDLGGVRLLGEVAAQYRWQWGAADRYQLRAGGVLSLHSELWDG